MRNPQVMEPGLDPAAAGSDAISVRARVDHGAFVLDVSVRLPAQGVTAIFGPSGCGKTTLLRAVAGLERPAPGRVAVGADVWQDDAQRIWRPTHRRALGMVFQDAALFDHLSVQANLDFGRKRVLAAQRRIAMAQAVELLGIGHLLARSPRLLSGGERQRVAIARALATSPRLLLMDEPLASLDAARKAELLPWFERLTRELDIPILYVTHALDEVARLADHLLLLEDGGVRAQGAAGALLSDLSIAQHHGDNAGAILEGQVVALDARDGLMSIAFAGGELSCVQHASDERNAVGSRLRLRILARDVSLARTRAADTSILNILPVTVRNTMEDGPAQLLVAVDAGGQRLLARVTRRSARALKIAAGQALYAQIKSVAILD